MKQIKEYFSEFRSKGSICEALVEAVVIYRKAKTMNLKISCSNHIAADEIQDLEDFIKSKFDLKEVKVILSEPAEVVDIGAHPRWRYHLF